MKRLLILTACIVVGLPLLMSDALAQETPSRDVDKSGTTSAAFLLMPVGARATAMGSAYSAVVDDGTAMYWNPAGLASVQEPVLLGEYATWIAEINFNFAGVTVPTSVGTFGLSVTSMRSPEMEVTRETIPDYRTGETFRASSYAVGVSYGRALTNRFSIGGSAKFIQERIHFSSASGLAVDVGTMFKTPFRGIRLGASIANFGTEMQMSGDDLNIRVPEDQQDGLGSGDATGSYATEKFDLPLTMRIGLAGEIFDTEFSRVTLAVDALHPNSADQFVNVGGEVALAGGLLLLRGGYNELFLESSERSFALGGGLRYGFGTVRFALDYAYEAHRYFAGVNRFTLQISL